MKILIIFSLFFWSCSSAIALAVPSLGHILGDSSLNHYHDTGKEAAWMTPSGESTALLLFEGGGFRDNTSFGIYSFQYSPNAGHAVLGNMLELFGGAADPIGSATLRVDQQAGTVTNLGSGQSVHMRFGNDQDGNLGQFGFYVTNTENNGGFTWYSHTTLNCEYVGPVYPGWTNDCGTGGYHDPSAYYRYEDHALIFDTSDNTQSALLGSDLVVAFEDLCYTRCGSDYDYDDMVVGLSMVVVSEPSSVLVLLTGLFILTWRHRKRFNLSSSKRVYA